MLLLEILGIDAGPMGSGYHRTGKQTGRPHEYKLRPRPKRNLVFKNIDLWHRDMYLTHNGNFDLLTDEKEECLIACDHDRRMAYGKWDRKNHKGMTFKRPRPLKFVTNAKRMKEYKK